MTKKTVIIAIVAILAFVPFDTLAQNSIHPVAMTQEQREKMLRETGGPIETPEIGPWISIVNGQSLISDAVYDNEIASIKRVFKVPVHTSSDTNYWRKVAKAEVAAGAAFAVVVGNCEKELSSLVILPSDQIAFVNICALISDSEDVLNERFGKELVRAVALTFGLGYSTSAGSILKPINSLTELDSISGKQLGPDVMSSSMRQIKDRGMTILRKVPYKMAVIQGWAPPPTNDYQRAIWDAAKAAAATNAPAAKSAVPAVK